MRTPHLPVQQRQAYTGLQDKGGKLQIHSAAEQLQISSVITGPKAAKHKSMTASK